MIDKIKWTISPFCELSTAQLYDVLHLRNKVFVMEQKDIYLDVDYADQYAYHLMAYGDEQLVAYCRIFPPTLEEKSAKIGRVVVASDFRKYGLGRILMHNALKMIDDELNAPATRIAAQVYLQKFYESMGFVSQGEPYMDGSIEHIDMVRQ